MDETEVQQRARLFVASAGTGEVRGDLSPYLKAANAVLLKQELGPGESGMTITRSNGKHIITVNTLDSEVRQRFTICHEIAHVVLELPSSHEETPPWAPVKRDKNEIACDTFAAELLMPYKLWLKSVPPDQPSIDLIEKLASEFGCSYLAAASRYATLAHFPCAFVIMERGKIRFAARSLPLRRANAWISPRTMIPSGSVACRLRGEGLNGSDIATIDQDIWFQEWEPGLECRELSRHDPSWDNTSSLIWFEEEDLVVKEADRFGRVVPEEPGLDELTGVLPWPGRSKRRR